MYVITVGLGLGAVSLTARGTQTVPEEVTATLSLTPHDVLTAARAGWARPVLTCVCMGPKYQWTAGIACVNHATQAVAVMQSVRVTEHALMGNVTVTSLTAGKVRCASYPDVQV